MAGEPRSWKLLLSWSAIYVGRTMLIRQVIHTAHSVFARRVRNVRAEQVEYSQTSCQQELPMESGMPSIPPLQAISAYHAASIISYTPPSIHAKSRLRSRLHYINCTIQHSALHVLCTVKLCLYCFPNIHQLFCQAQPCLLVS